MAFYWFIFQIMSSRRSSDIWYHFIDKAANRAECKYCKSILSIAAGSLGNLRRHLKTKHPTIPIERTSSSTPSQVRAGTSTSCERSRSPSTSSTDITVSDSHVESTSSTSMDNLHPSRPQHLQQHGNQSSLTDFITIAKPMSVKRSQAIDIQLLKMICKEYHPFSLVEDREFKEFVTMLNPSYKLPSRKTLSESLLPQLYSNLVADVKKKLADSLAVALTTDGWTSINNESFIAITAHYINSDSKLCSSLLGVFEFHARHTAENLAEIIKDKCQEWEISEKVVVIVTDNAANIVAAVNTNWKHIPCYAHTLNLVVKSSISPIFSIVEKCKTLVQFFKKSSHALSKLHETQKQMGLPELKLIQDVPTRWNSTYDMLKRIVSNKEPMLSTLAVLGYDEVKLSADEWNIVQHAIDILEVFDEVTKELSSEQSVTLSKTIVLSRNLYNFVSRMLQSQNLPSLVKEMCNKLIKEVNDRLIAKEQVFIPESTLLDPRFKKSAFKNSSKFDAVYQALVGKIQAQMNTPHQCDPLPQMPKPSSSKIWAEFDKETDILRARQNPRAASIVEIDKYLAEPLLDRNADPLIWWQQRKLIYPNIYKLMVERLCIPASSVPCERIFSKAGQVLIERRSRLKGTKVSKMLFIQYNS
ncbi:E3 SUMO-protein ligase ZBED1-like [Nilaparvata lugens]|uniref:E3 SUMO-protein ligase ZBED1-like n=1 Tax=Nilaparvata lugens TaxID=108931 RepID=UPI00193DCB6B|nr:E3 SUMO-protein ligase ZBED1-like [Nilaparvata lugens]